MQITETSFTNIYKPNNFKVVIERFDSDFEYYDYMLSPKQELLLKAFSMKNGFEYCSVKNKMLNGDARNLEKFRDRIFLDTRRLTDGERNQFCTLKSVVGNRPNVPAFLNNSPINMYRNVIQIKKEKIVSVYIDIGVLGSVTQEEKEYKFSLILAKCLALEAKGYRVKINYIKPTIVFDLNTIYCATFPLKKENRIIDVKKLVFPLVDIEALRVVHFSWLWDICDRRNEERPDNLGYSLYAYREFIIPFVKTLKEKNEKCFYVNYTTDVDALFNDLN